MTKKRLAWTILAVGAITVLILLVRAHRLGQPITIEGAVVETNADTRKELPIANAAITASDGTQSVTGQSDAAGYFKVKLQKRPLSGQPIMLGIRHTNYEPLDLELQTGRLLPRTDLTVAKMVPLATATVAGAHRAESVVSSIRVRYTINSRTETDVGSAVKTFQVFNQANVPCKKQFPCSSDGKWRAASGSASLHAGADNVFNNIRASCIAGPCPFTSVDSTEALNGQRNIQISALNWSETATFLVEAEVFHIQISSNVRELYPVVFGRGLNFTLPPTAEGVSLQAEIDASPMVFPLSPDLNMSWASCTVRNDTEKEKIAVYRCELKPGYRF
jgi:hypothetical protein